MWIASTAEQSWSVHGVAWQWGLFTSRLETRTKESMAGARWNGLSDTPVVGQSCPYPL
jgi:hypothetical protein